MKYLPSPPPPPISLRGQITRDERGITLQTLIVTTVLVLMAVAAGVVIMAITNSANDRLRGQQTDQDSACDPWEVHDVGLEAAGRGGGQGGLDSSAIGCRRVCYVTVNANLKDTTNPGSEVTVGVIDSSGDDLRVTKEDFEFNRNDIRTPSLDITVADNATSEETGSGKVPVNGRNTVDLNGNQTGKLEAKITEIIFQDASSHVTFNDNLSFAVHASGDYCIVEDSTQTTANQRQVLRSKR